MPASKIEIALWPRGSFDQEYFDSLLARYYQGNKFAQVNTRWLNAQNPWTDVSQTMIHRSGVDLSEIGASWVESLVATNSLRPFSAKKFQSLGGDAAFIQPAWKNPNDDNLVYSIPHMVDVRHLYYRRDLLAQAGVDEADAFTTPQNFLQTLESLKRAGIQSPLAMPIMSQRMNLSFIASWVWGAGADFIDSVGNRATFDSPAALNAIADYFRAAEYIAPELRQMEIGETDMAFCKGDSAITLSGSWLFYALQKIPEYAHVKENLGISLPVGKPYTGGTHFVVWEHCVQEEAVFDFIRFLTSAQVQADFSLMHCVLPARLGATQLTPFAGDPNYEMLVKDISSGRSYSASPLWNIVEERLSRALVQFWSEYFATPNVDASAFLSAHLGALARRINITLED